jgi:hypothetical protein
MKNTLLACVAMLLCFAAAAQNETLRQQIDALQEKLNTAVEQNDVAALGQYLHPQFYVHVIDGPFIQKDTLLASFSKGGNPYKIFRPKTATFIVLDKNTIITSGREIFQHKEGKYAGQDHHREFYHVWLRHKGKWLIAGRNVVIID